MSFLHEIRTPILIMWSLIIIVYIIRSPTLTWLNPPSTIDDKYYEMLNPSRFTEYGLVTNISDGDTLTIDESYDVRLMGIDTPELAHPEIFIKEECFGKDASLRLKQLLANTYVYLFKDQKDVDHYNRRLRFVFVPDRGNPTRYLSVNAYMVGEGFARAYALEPNQTYKQKIAALQQEAIQNKKGLWGTCDREKFRW
ncbi:MAG TPA: thermonuclease family protein [Candidatus Woesebacteria bacterium]|nr:thermonuclease family protein [Candidatus Woesebacteria bacterium]HNS95086.1 thermonuclease family protein [Candidatus Woesebacteria bacterium]